MTAVIVLLVLLCLLSGAALCSLLLLHFKLDTFERRVGVRLYPMVHSLYSIHYNELRKSGMAHEDIHDSFGRPGPHDFWAR